MNEFDQHTQIVQSRLVIPECGPLAGRQQTKIA
jgi:hypothetical protein